MTKKFEVALFKNMILDLFNLSSTIVLKIDCLKIKNLLKFRFMIKLYNTISILTLAIIHSAKRFVQDHPENKKHLKFMMK